MNAEDQVEYWTTLSLRDIETAGILIAADRPLEAIAEMNRFSVHGRYPLSIDYRPPADEVARCWPRAREVLECLLPRSSPS